MGSDLEGVWLEQGTQLSVEQFFSQRTSRISGDTVGCYVGLAAQTRDAAACLRTFKMLSSLPLPPPTPPLPLAKVIQAHLLTMQNLRKAPVRMRRSLENTQGCKFQLQLTCVEKA